LATSFVLTVEGPVTASAADGVGLGVAFTKRSCTFGHFELPSLGLAGRRFCRSVYWVIQERLQGKYCSQEEERQTSGRVVIVA